VHHRVKNNLQVIDSLLRLQSDAFPDSRLSRLIDETANRVHVIAEIHQLLYQSTDLTNFDVAEFVQRLCESLVALFSRKQRPQLLVHADQLRIDLQHAVPLGLVLNELISNALKHAFPDGRGGSIRIDLHREGSWIAVSVADDGIGFPDRLPSGSLGMQLVRVLTEQLKRELRCESSGGARVSVRFPAA
jgi:two-component system, sensor histidine kinase PdtaS